MADMIFGSGMGPWVCPNDRQLALRAKLQTGWSVHTFRTEKQRRTQALSPKELEIILGVIRRAEELDTAEQQRVGRLVERLENMRRNAMGNGLSQCLLCGELLGLLGSASVFCQDCRKKVCTKCGIEAAGTQKRPLWLCKICSEQREVWKRSGAWFYKGLPKFILPVRSSRTLELQPQPWQGEGMVPEPDSAGSGRSFPWARVKAASGDSDSDSDSELSSCSLEDVPGPGGWRSSPRGQLRAAAAPTGAPSRTLGLPPCPPIPGSPSSLGSERGIELSPPDSTDQPSDHRGGHTPGKRRIHTRTRL